MINEYGVAGGMIIGRGNRSTRRRRLRFIPRLQLKKSQVLEADDAISRHKYKTVNVPNNNL
jgi:hypothetical protein